MHSNAPVARDSAQPFGEVGPGGPGRAGRSLAIIVGAALLGVVLTGCATVSGAVSEGQQALDQGRDVVESAADSVAAADDLIAAGTELAAACAAAQAAWVPGVSTQDARSAIDEAVRIVDGVVARTPDFPGARELGEALDTAQGALSGGSLGVSQQSLETACALVSMGG